MWGDSSCLRSSSLATIVLEAWNQPHAVAPRGGSLPKRLVGLALAAEPRDEYRWWWNDSDRRTPSRATRDVSGGAHRDPRRWGPAWLNTPPLTSDGNFPYWNPDPLATRPRFFAKQTPRLPPGGLKAILMLFERSLQSIANTSRGACRVLGYLRLVATAVLLATTGCLLGGGSGSEIPARVPVELPGPSAFPGLHGTWRNQPPSLVSGILSGTWSGLYGTRFEVALVHDGSASLCWIDGPSGGKDWLRDADGPVCSRAGTWQPISQNVFRLDVTLLEDRDQWVREVGYVGFSVHGDTLAAWRVRYLLGEGPLVGTTFRDADDPDDEYAQSTLTVAGKWITEIIVDGSVDVVDTSLYQLVDSTTIVRWSSAGSDPDTLQVLPLPRGYGLARRQDLREAGLPGHALLRKP